MTPLDVLGFGMVYGAGFVLLAQTLRGMIMRVWRARGHGAQRARLFAREIEMAQQVRDIPWV